MFYIKGHMNERRMIIIIKDEDVKIIKDYVKFSEGCWRFLKII